MTAHLEALASAAYTAEFYKLSDGVLESTAQNYAEIIPGFYSVTPTGFPANTYIIVSKNSAGDEVSKNIYKWDGTGEVEATLSAAVLTQLTNIQVNSEIAAEPILNNHYIDTATNEWVLEKADGSERVRKQLLGANNQPNSVAVFRSNS